MRHLLLSLLLLLLPPLAPSAELTSEQQTYLDNAKQAWQEEPKRRGRIELGGGIAELEVPEGFYYLDPEQSEQVLVEAWGNPPGYQTLGMLFPSELTPFDLDTWAVTIEYTEDGHIPDTDAAQIDFDKLLAEMQAEVARDNQLRSRDGYPSMELLGWASKPLYDADHHKLFWAQEIKFSDSDQHTLNYNIRILGRKGVLVLNFVGSMRQKLEIEQNIDSVLGMANFSQGSRYSDFDPQVDELATYGIAALVAGKLAANSGLFSAALLLLKKYGLLLIAAIVALLGRYFMKRKKNS